MTVLREFGRREFLIGGVSGALGLALGVYVLSEREKGREGAPAGFSPSAWIHITPDNGVRIVVSKSEMGQGVRTSLTMLVAEELEAHWSAIRVEQAETDSVYGEQRTQGSSSVRTMWFPLRRAGATAREMLVTAAAQSWGVARTACHAEDGWVIHEDSGRRVRYGEVASAAASLPVPKNVALKNKEQWRLLGRPLRQLDAPSKTQGRTIYGIDVRLLGMLYAAVLRSPFLGGVLREYDASKAERVRGVHGVYRISNGVGVVADSSWSAFSARAAIDAKWTPGPNSRISQETLRDSLEQALKRPGGVGRNDGNVNKALGGAQATLEATYEVPYLAHAALEPINCTASVHWNRCEIWCSTQNPQAIQRRAARVALLPPSWVDVHTTFIGGGFGRRLESDMVEDAVELSKTTGVPVQVVWSREDDLRHDVYRPSALSHFAAGLDAEGELVAWKHKLVSQAIDLPRGSDRPAWTSIQGAADLPYTIPNIRVECVDPQLPIPVGYWRSVGYSLNAFFTECFLDEIAAASGKDPYELRRKLLRNNPRMTAVLELAMEKSNWYEALPPGKGRGLAIHRSYRTIVAQVAEISCAGSELLKVERVVCALDCGRTVNPATVEAQVQGGIVFGLSAALWGAITMRNGQVVESNYDSYRVLRMREMPKVEVHIVNSEELPTGVGEVAVPPIAPAVANAFFRASGKRIRRLPMVGSPSD